ncbi:hypothetical protein BJ684DRAFT_16519 [Piptocephalis cylindrospora]|uniref:Uncharacterized protein n=1 Tax=Piptocephalis cylindrospora TaxID=1907219 RepID=A0A4P9Y301_9FUNG|nr:hypothetical protein BJ684DRAFT_16519 [Piptocephalis cylindrospora]|eukprot:RKP13044.1 hypothetical protein BJ684DRAFT_16519 [Piptocephalis cylindrospora]
MASTTASETPATAHVLTIRMIKSFEYRNFKNLLLHDVPLTLTVAELKERALTQMRSSSGYKPFLNVTFDTMKMYTQAYGAKTNNLIINLDHPEWVLQDDAILADLGFQNETEVSFFNGSDYDAYMANPENKW